MTPETLRKWVRRAETDEGLRPGLTTSERERMKALERENRELRRANEILKAAAVFFGGSSTATATDDRLHRRTPPGPRGRADLRELPIAPSAYYAAKGRPPSPRALRDVWLLAEIRRAYGASRRRYGPRKVWGS